MRLFSGIISGCTPPPLDHPLPLAHPADRDLKPENFLFKGPGPGEGEPVIIDFGLSKMTDAPDDHMATRVGTPYYIAPEVIQSSFCWSTSPKHEKREAKIEKHEQNTRAGAQGSLLLR